MLSPAHRTINLSPEWASARSQHSRSGALRNRLPRKQAPLIILNAWVEGGALGVQKLNSATPLIQRHQGGYPIQTRHYIGLDVHKRTIGTDNLITLCVSCHGKRHGGRR
jgi:hypothetical protein